MHVVQEPVRTLVDGAHRVVHGDLVETLTGVGSDPGGLGDQGGEERATRELYRTATGDAVGRIWEGEPVQNGGCDVWG